MIEGNVTLNLFQGLLCKMLKQVECDIALQCLLIVDSSMTIKGDAETSGVRHCFAMLTHR